MKPIRKVQGGGAAPTERTFTKKKQKADELPFHHHWRVGVHRHKGELYIKLPGGTPHHSCTLDHVLSLC